MHDAGADDVGDPIADPRSEQVGSVGLHVRRLGFWGSRHDVAGPAQPPITGNSTYLRESNAPKTGETPEQPSPPRFGAVAAASEHRTRRSGRAAYFPGINRLAGALPVRDVLAWSSIERVSVLIGGDADPDTVLQTRNFLRPRWQDGQLVLAVQEGPHGTLVPFEVPKPTPCCADHTR